MCLRQHCSFDFGLAKQHLVLLPKNLVIQMKTMIGTRMVELMPSEPGALPVAETRKRLVMVLKEVMLQQYLVNCAFPSSFEV